MSTKSKIQKVKNEVQAHEDRGWLKGYEEGLANREEEVVIAQNALKARNDKIRELKHQKNAPKTARDALDLAWNLAHPVKEGQVIPEGTPYLMRSDDGAIVSDVLARDVVGHEAWTDIRLLDPLPGPEPDWLDAPAVIAAVDTCPSRTMRVPDEEHMWRCVCTPHCPDRHYWDELLDVVPLYPKED